MKKVIESSITILFLLMFANKSDSQDLKEIRLSGINNTSSALKEYHRVNVFFKIDTIQHITAGGIEFLVKLINNSNENIVLKNPLDFLQIMLFNESGYNVTIPQTQRIKINSTNKLISYETFKVKKVTLNKKEYSIDSFFKEEITIPLRSEYEITVKIEDILVTQNGKIISNTNKEKIVAGEYRFGITISLVGDGIKSQMFQTDPVKINYK